jgi:membrane-associated phospholipid phosphatase
LSTAATSLKKPFLKQYGFVDYATQTYAALVAVLVLLFHNRTVPNWPGILAVHAAILGGVHVLIQTHGRGRGGRPIDFLRHFYPVLLYIWFFAETGWLNRMFFSEYLDPLVIRADQGLFGCQPSIEFMQRVPYLAVSELFYAAYFSYYIMIVGVGLALYLRRREQFFHYLSVISFVFYICYTIYVVVPIIGPRVFLHDPESYHLPQELQRLAPGAGYPESVQGGAFYKLMAFIYRVFEAPGAAFPSSHVAIAFCTVFFSFRYLRPIRFVHLVAALLLCLSTIYCRYHYVVDVLAGAVTAALLAPLGNWCYFRFTTSGSETEAEEARIADGKAAGKP